MKEIEKPLEGDSGNGQMEKAAKAPVRMVIAPRECDLQQVTGKLKMNEDILDYIANECVEVILGGHG